MGEFRMPSLGADMDAGTLVAWHIKPGEAVARGTIVADVETEKGIVEVEIWEGGVVESLCVEPGTKVPVGTVLAMLRADGAPAARSPAPAEKPANVAPQPAPAPPAPQPTTQSTAHSLASPAARQLARERGVDIATIHGTGPHGAVTRGDVERAAVPSSPPVEKPPPAPPPVQPAAAPPAFDAAAMRKAIAAAMTRSKREIPHYYLSTEIDVATASSWLQTLNERRTVTERILFASLLLKATALAIHEVPEVNGFFVDGAFRASEATHLGVAVSLRRGGLIAPAIHDVAAKSLGEVQAALVDLVSRVRAGKLRSSEMSDPTITVTNLGEQGVESVFGVIYPPQVALVGFGRIVERAWASDGMVGARPVLTATLSGDHRVSDGHRGAVFLSTIGRLLREPEKL